MSNLSVENSWNESSIQCSGYLGKYYSSNPKVEKYYELYITNCVLNAVSSITAIIGNSIILAALLTTRSLRTPSYWLITSQVCTDLALGFSQPLVAALMFSEMLNVQQHIVCILGQITIFMCIFLLTATGCGLVALSIDRFLAVKLKQGYKVTVTFKRVRISIAILWGFSLVLAIFAFLLNDIKSITMMFLVFLVGCSSITAFCYIGAVKILQTYMKEVYDSGVARQTNPSTLNIYKYKRSLWTLILLEFLVVVFAIPVGVSWIYLYINGLTVDGIVLMYTSITFLNLNSSVNPIVYMTRITDIRQACSATFRKLFCRGVA